MRKNPKEIIKKIYECLEQEPELSLSRLSRKARIDLRTLTRYLDLITWIKSQPYVFERKGKRGARIFCLTSKPETELELVRRPYAVAAGREKIRMMIDFLTLSSKIQGTAEQTFERFTQRCVEEFYRWNKMILNAIPVAAIYFACRKFKLPLTLEEIVDACRKVHIDTYKEEIEFSYHILKDLADKGRWHFFLHIYF